MKISVPVIRSVDFLVLGGTVSACRTAMDLSRKGRSVAVITPFSYFGEDLCAYLDLQSPKSRDYREIFGDLTHPTPMQIKHKLDKEMIDAGVFWLFQSHPAALLRDDHGQVAGAVFANRSGFQAITARCILDATRRSIAARLDGAADEKPFVPGDYPVSLIQAGACREAEGTTVQRLPEPLKDGGNEYPVFKLTRMIRFDDASARSFCHAQTEMRRACWHPDMIFCADSCRIGIPEQVCPPDPARGILIPEQFGLAEEIGNGREVGAPVCATGPDVLPDEKLPEGFETVRKDVPFRFQDAEKIDFEINTIPVRGVCDVLVCGAGTGGAPAAIASARSGARTIAAETAPYAGGCCTVGRIGVYWYGNRIGFTKELDDGCWNMGGNPRYERNGHCDTFRKQEWLMEQGLDAGAEYRFNTMTVGAVVQKTKVCGAILAGDFGLETVLASECVDSTGNADLTAAAGGSTMPLVEEEPAVQGAGLAPVKIGSHYENTDYNFICDSDVLDGSRMFVAARGKFSGWFDTTSLLDTRERRRISGDVMLQPQDFYANRTYRDTINIATSNFDTHGFIIHPMFMLKHTEEDPYSAKVPFRALLPRDLDGVIVTGLAVSAHRDCMPLIRMQPDVQNQGYAAGLAAAMAAKGKKTLRQIDIRELQKKLIAKGILPESILAETDAIGGIAKESSHYELASIFLDPEKALPSLREKLAQSPDDLHTALILAFLGDGSGMELIKKTADVANGWDDGWNYRGMGQFGKSISELDCMIFALDRIGGSPEIIRRKLGSLTIESDFSHIRAVCVHLIHHPDPEASGELLRLLRTRGASGHAVRTYADALAANREERNDTGIRNSQLRELYLAKALHACDPENETANRILKEYATGLQGYYAIFAQKA